jgi:hypothetical protein
MSAAPERFSRTTNLAAVQGSARWIPRAARYRLELRVGLFVQSGLGALKVALCGSAWRLIVRTPECQPGSDIVRMGGLALGVSAIYLKMQTHTEE